MKLVVNEGKNPEAGESPESQTVVAELRAVHSTAGGAQEENSWPLFATPTRIMVGRDAACDWSFGDQNMRRRHCLFMWDGKSLMAKSQIAGYEWSFVVAPGTVVKLGSVRIVFSVLAGHEEPDQEEDRTNLFRKNAPPLAPPEEVEMPSHTPVPGEPYHEGPTRFSQAPVAPPKYVEGPTRVNIIVPPARPQDFHEETRQTPAPKHEFHEETRQTPAPKYEFHEETLQTPKNEFHEEQTHAKVEVGPMNEARVVKPQDGWAGPDSVTRTFTTPTAGSNTGRLRLQMPPKRVLLYSGAGVWLTGLMVWIMWPTAPTRPSVQVHKPEAAASAKATPTKKPIGAATSASATATAPTTTTPAEPRRTADKPGRAARPVAEIADAPSEKPAPEAPKMFGPEPPKQLARAIDAYQRGNRSEARALFEALTDRADVGTTARFMVELLTSQLEHAAPAETAAPSPLPTH